MVARLLRRALVVLAVAAALGLAVYLVATHYDPQPAPEPNQARREIEPVDAATLKRSARVVLVTLDGARWQDVLDQPGALAPADQRPALRRALAASRANGAILVGTTSSHVPLSLPGYQAIAAGRPTDCLNNVCPRIDVETLAEGLARRLEVPADQIAVFASWARLSDAATSHDDTVHVDCPPEGRNPGPAWRNARLDEDTVARALSHWRAHHPRFLHLALLDMDEHAHAGYAEGVVTALERADAAIAELLHEISLLPEEERRLTTLLITTDHGRGPGPLWSDHGPFNASRTLFLLAIGDRVTGGKGTFSQADLRPTIERLFGLSGASCEGEACGAVIDAVTEPEAPAHP